MKGQFELTATFIKMIQIALLIMGALAIFFTYIEYEIFVYQDSAGREAQIIGNALLSSPCLNDGSKGILTEQKLDIMDGDDSCFSYSKGKVEVNAPSGNWEINFGDANIGEEAKFDVLVKYDTGTIELGELKMIL